MKRIQTSWFVVLIFAGLTGCAMHRVPNGNGCLDGSCAAMPENGAMGGAPCETCRNGCRGAGGDPSDGFFHPGSPACSPSACQGRCPCGRAGAGGDEGDAGGPPVGAVTYPYYTVRGPRDFLAKNPPSIGP
jgi:hypothetical protein